MNTHKPSKPKFSEDDVESLLFDFFRHEMPAELKTPNEDGASPARRPASSGNRPSPQTLGREPQPAREGRTTRASAVAGLSAAACALMLAVTALLTGNPKTDRNRPDAAPSQAKSAHTKQPRLAADDAGEPDRPTVPVDNRTGPDIAAVAGKNDAARGKSDGSRQPPRVLPVEESWVLELLPVEFREYVQQEKPDWWHQLNIDIVNPLPDEPEDDGTGTKRPDDDTPPRLPEEEHRR